MAAMLHSPSARGPTRRPTSGPHIATLALLALLAPGGAAQLPGATADVPPGDLPEPAPGVLRLALIADVHQDLIPDAEVRLRSFVRAAEAAGAAGIVQLGDFCTVAHDNVGFLEVFESFDGPRHHVIGNHDTDGGHSRAEVVAFWRLPGRYYSFDLGGFHFVVLDANDPNRGTPRTHPWSMAEDQLAWLGEDLAAAAHPVVVLVHQFLPTDLRNFDRIRGIFAAHHEAGGPPVAAVLCGHHHADRHERINGVHYVIINSASYRWLGPKYAHRRFPDELHARWPALAAMAPYDEPLWAIADLDPRGEITIHGREADWVGRTPWECGLPREEPRASRCVPEVRDRVLEFDVADAGDRD